MKKITLILTLLLLSNLCVYSQEEDITKTSEKYPYTSLTIFYGYSKLDIKQANYSFESKKENSPTGMVSFRTDFNDNVNSFKLISGFDIIGTNRTINDSIFVEITELGIPIQFSTVKEIKNSILPKHIKTYWQVNYGVSVNFEIFQEYGNKNNYTYGNTNQTYFNYGKISLNYDIALNFINEETNNGATIGIKQIYNYSGSDFDLSKNSPYTFNFRTLGIYVGAIF